MALALATIAALSAFLGVLMMTMALGGRRQENPVRARVRNLAAHLPEEETVDLTLPFSQRVIWPIFAGLGNGLAKLLPTTFVSRIRHLLMLAGEPFSLTGFLALMILTGVAAPGLFLALLLLGDASFGSMQLLGLLAFTFVGFYLPYFWLARRVRRRQDEIFKSLPNALDLVTTCVEAGLGLDSAFAKVAERLPGPFGDELAHALREMALGRSRRDALREVGERTGVSDVITFVNSIIHAEMTGSSIGDVLRVQADHMRTRRRQRVEQIAQRIPIWMTFPLVIFLLPSLFIAILGPAAIQVLDSLAR
jgi:tight adherence protein C